MTDICRFMILWKAVPAVADGGYTRSRNTACTKPPRSHSYAYFRTHACIARKRSIMDPGCPDRYVIIFMLYPEHYKSYNIAAAFFCQRICILTYMVCYVAAESGGSPGGRLPRGAGEPRPCDRGGSKTEMMRGGVELGLEESEEVESSQKRRQRQIEDEREKERDGGSWGSRG